MRQRPLLLGPAVGQLGGEEPAVRDENVAVDAERDGEAVLGAEGEADVGRVGVVELVPGATAADEVGDAVLEQHLPVHGARGLELVRLGRGGDGVDARGGVAGVVVLLVGHHVEEGGAGARFVERQRRRGHGVEQPRVERGVELGVAGGVGRRRVGGLGRSGVGGGRGGAGGRRVHGVRGGAGRGGGARGGGGWGWGVAAETVGRAAPGCGEVEGNEVGRGGELGERPGSGRSGHIGLGSPVGWGWACGDSRRAGAAGHGKRLSSFEAGSGVGAGQGSNGGVTAGTPPAGRGWLSSEPADGRWKAGRAIKYPVFGGGSPPVRRGCTRER